MKKAVFILLVSVLLTGCRENYLAEKAYYHAAKTLGTVKNEDLKANPEVLKPIVAAFEQVVEKYPTTPKARESLSQISLLKAGYKDYDGARAALLKIIQNFSQVGESASEASFQIAQLYEFENRWDLAEKRYWVTAETYPLQTKGLYAPLYVLLHYKQTKDPVKQTTAYQMAVEHYESLLSTIGPIEASTAVKNYLALTHLTNDDWQKARREWLSISDQFPNSGYAPLALLTIAELSTKHNDIEQAINDYERFMNKYSKQTFAGKTAIRLGLLYESQKQYVKSREWFERALNQYFKDSSAGSADVKLLIGKSYQTEKQWEKANEIYTDLESQLPVSVAGLQVPFLRFLHFKDLGEIENGNRVLDEAISKYKKLVEEKPNSKISAYARQFMLSAYTQKKDWNQLMERVDQEIQSEAIEERKGRWLFLKALIAENRMKDKEQAASIYQDFLTQYPGHPLSQLAKSHQELVSKAG